jgi:hypothetical protein
MAPGHVTNHSSSLTITASLHLGTMVRGATLCCGWLCLLAVPMRADGGGAGIVTALRDAAELLDKGLLSSDEFTTLKHRLLTEQKTEHNGRPKQSSQSLPRFFGTALAAHTLQPHTELTVLDYQVIAPLIRLVACLLALHMI